VFARWLSRKTGHTYRLPTEAEWEYASRSGSDESSLWGTSADKACGFANVYDRSAQRELSGGTVFPCNDGYAKTAPVGSFKANAFGLLDMLGNVGEWIEDCRNKNYEGAPTDGRAWMTGQCSERGVRGGNWTANPRYLRHASRTWFGASDGALNRGFRLVREIP